MRGKEDLGSTEQGCACVQLSVRCVSLIDRYLTHPKNEDFGPVHGGDAPPFMGGPMGGQYHLRMRL